MSKMRWLKTKREPVEMSVAEARISGPVAAVEIAEGGAVEEDFVVQLGRQFGAAPARRRQPSPVRRAEGARDDLALHVAFQEALLVLGEQLLAVEAIGQRGEAAAGHAGDDVDLVEQAHPVALRSDDLGSPKELQHAVGKRGGARAAAREGEDDQIALVLEIHLARLETIALARIGLRDRRVDRAGGATAEQEQHGERRQRYGPQRSHCVTCGRVLRKGMQACATTEMRHRSPDR